MGLGYSKKREEEGMVPVDNDLNMNPNCSICSLPTVEHIPIVIPIGYDVSGHSAGGHGGVMPSLSARREIVEQLDSEPLFDYLVQNGALDKVLVDEMRNEKSAAKVNLALLKHVETSGRCALNLFLNALRQTGQHHIANLLDEGVRLKQLSGSGYLSKKRHRGQVSLHINVRAMRLMQEERIWDDGKMVTNFISQFNREWISLEDIKARIAELTDRKRTPPQQFDFSEAMAEERQKEKSGSCLCHCFTRLFARRKDGMNQNNHNGNINHVMKKQPNGLSKHNNSDRTSPYKEIKLNNEQIADNLKHHNSKNDLENLRTMEDMFHRKAEELNAILRDPNSCTFMLLQKYFEQERGVLVLDTNCEKDLVIVNICMKNDQLDQLRRDYNSGKLNRDLESCIITDEVLEKMGAKGIKLGTDIDREEFEIAEQELM